MSKHLTYVVVSLFLVVIVAAQTAIADSVTVELAEKTPPADLGDPILSAPPPTTTTTTTLPTIPRCPDELRRCNFRFGFWIQLLAPLTTSRFAIKMVNIQATPK